jgi:hypothetical protein
VVGEHTHDQQLADSSPGDGAAGNWEILQARTEMTMTTKERRALLAYARAQREPNGRMSELEYDGCVATPDHYQAAGVWPTVITAEEWAAIAESVAYDNTDGPETP